MRKHKKNYKKKQYNSYNKSMSQRQFERNVIITIKFLWKVLYWSIFIAFSVSVWLWEQGTYFFNHGEKKMGYLVRTLTIVPFAILLWGGFFTYTNWQVIAIDGFKTAVCLKYPVTCAKDQIKDAMAQDILQKAASGQLFVPVQVHNQK